MAIYVSRRKKLEGVEIDGVALFKLMVRARVKTDYSFYQFSGELEQFEAIWCCSGVLCRVEGGELKFGDGWG